jgi:hypothetical protein
MRIDLLTTADFASPRRDLLLRLFNSLVTNKQHLSHDLRLFMLFQNASEANRAEIEAMIPPFTQIMLHPTRLSLSKARNAMLQPLLNEGAFSQDTILAFPDDDCFYTPDFWPLLVQAFQENPELDFWFCRYGEKPLPLPHSALPPSARQPQAFEVVRRCSSNTMIFRGCLAPAIGLFDENLGVGTPNKSSEDIDYALRGFGHARKSLFLDEKYVGHREAGAAPHATYYRGALMVIARYQQQFGLRREYIRKILIGMVYVLRRRLTFGQFLSDVKASLSPSKLSP